MWLRVQNDASHDGFEPVSEQDAACRGANSADNLAEYYSVNEAFSLGACKDLCRSRGSDCKGIEFWERQHRCEVWVRPEGIQSSISMNGFACLRYDHSLDSMAGTSGHFNPVDGGTSRACRGATTTDDSPRYYDLSTAGSLEGCQNLCRATSSCKGIEYSSSGRCEIWKISIQSSKAVQGFACFRYEEPESGSVDDSAFELSPVDGGASRACRGASATDDSADYYQLFSASSLDVCQNFCLTMPECKGIEYSSTGRCEVWTRDIQASKSIEGFTCLRMVPKL